MTVGAQFKPGTFVDAYHFIVDNPHLLLVQTGYLLELAFAALGIALVISLPLGLWLGHRHRGLFFAVSVTLYSPGDANDPEIRLSLSALNV